MYLVRSMFSETYTSANTHEYVERLKSCDDLPWYYRFYSYLKIDGDVKVPCDLDYHPVDRSQMCDDDKMLYRLHLMAVKSFRKDGEFYWLTNIELRDKFERAWQTITEDLE